MRHVQYGTGDDDHAGVMYETAAAIEYGRESARQHDTFHSVSGEVPFGFWYRSTSLDAASVSYIAIQLQARARAHDPELEVRRSGTVCVRLTSCLRINHIGTLPFCRVSHVGTGSLCDSGRQSCRWLVVRSLSSGACGEVESEALLRKVATARRLVRQRERKRARHPARGPTGARLSRATTGDIRRRRPSWTASSQR